MGIRNERTPPPPSLEKIQSLCLLLKKIQSSSRSRVVKRSPNHCCSFTVIPAPSLHVRCKEEAEAIFVQTQFPWS